MSKTIITPKKKTKTKKKTTSLATKKNALAYYDCLIDQLSKPVNKTAKITQLAHHCKCNKDQVALAKQEHKQKLLKVVAKNYRAFGQSLSRYLQADIIDYQHIKKHE